MTYTHTKNEDGTISKSETAFDAEGNPVVNTMVYTYSKVTEEGKPDTFVIRETVVLDGREFTSIIAQGFTLEEKQTRLAQYPEAIQRAFGDRNEGFVATLSQDQSFLQDELDILLTL